MSFPYSSGDNSSSGSQTNADNSAGSTAGDASNPYAQSGGQAYSGQQQAGSYQQQPRTGYPSQGNQQKYAYQQPGYSYGFPGQPIPGQPIPGQPGMYWDRNGLPRQQKSRVAAGILGIFLGGLGIHRFYLGYVGIGIVQLIVSILSFFIIGEIWGFIEGIIILASPNTFPTDAHGVPLGN